MISRHTIHAKMNGIYVQTQLQQQPVKWVNVVVHSEKRDSQCGKN